MSVTWTQGLILNVATLAGPPRRRPAGVRDARQVHPGGHDAAPGRGVGRPRHPLQRGRAARPRSAEPGPRLTGEADVASLALYLASEQGKTLSGCVFEAAP